MSDYSPVHTPVYTQADLDKARKDEREAAWRDAIAVVRGTLHAHASKDMQKACSYNFSVGEVLTALEAAATAKGDNDGTPK